MTMFVPILENARQKFVIEGIAVHPQAVSSGPSARKLEFDVRTTSGDVKIILPVSEAAMLMFEIGYALEQANRTDEAAADMVH
jgi:hypothetical protein